MHEEMSYQVPDGSHYFPFKDNSMVQDCIKKMLSIQDLMKDFNQQALKNDPVFFYSMISIVQNVKDLDQQLLTQLRSSKLSKWVNHYVVKEGIDIRYLLYTDWI